MGEIHLFEQQTQTTQQKLNKSLKHAILLTHAFNTTQICCPPRNDWRPSRAPRWEQGGADPSDEIQASAVEGRTYSMFCAGPVTSQRPTPSHAQTSTHFITHTFTLLLNTQACMPDSRVTALAKPKGTRRQTRHSASNKGNKKEASEEPLQASEIHTLRVSVYARHCVHSPLSRPRNVPRRHRLHSRQPTWHPRAVHARQAEVAAGGTQASGYVTPSP